MAFFKFRKGGDEQPTPAPAPESIEALRKRARHRLIGASVLVLAGVIGFPLVFDNQPRPVAVDIPIEIPDRNKVKPLVPPEAAVTTVAANPAPTPETAPAKESRQPEEVVISPAASSSHRAAAGQISAASAPMKPAPKLEPRPDPKPAEIPVEKTVPKPVANVDDGAKAQALLEGKSADVAKPVAASGARFVVQVGAYADVVKAREARMKLERAGIKTYTQVVQSSEGKRIRVRVGPVESKAEVDKLAEKIRKLNLTAQILEL